MKPWSSLVPLVPFSALLLGLPLRAERELPVPAGPAAVLVGAGWISTERNEYNLSLTAAGTMLAFARSEAGFREGRVMVATRGAEGWGEPRPAPFTHEGWTDSDPWLTPRGDWLYFISNRPADGQGPARKDLDLWRVHIGTDGFGPPEPLAVLNSSGNELGPEVHGGWIYFNSSRPGGPAKVSIYRAPLAADGSIGTPEPLPAPFNDGLAQGDFTLSPEGTLAVFWSMRPEHPKEGHLYAARRTGDGWTRAVRLPVPFGSEAFDFTPEFSADGKTLYFASMRRVPGEDPALSNGQSNLFAVAARELDQAVGAALSSPP